MIALRFISRLSLLLEAESVSDVSPVVKVESEPLVMFWDEVWSGVCCDRCELVLSLVLVLFGFILRAELLFNENVERVPTPILVSTQTSWIQVEVRFYFINYLIKVRLGLIQWTHYLIINKPNIIFIFSYYLYNLLKFTEFSNRDISLLFDLIFKFLTIIKLST